MGAAGVCACACAVLVCGAGSCSPWGIGHPATAGTGGLRPTHSHLPTCALSGPHHATSRVALRPSVLTPSPSHLLPPAASSHLPFTPP
eukprot:4774997-Prymnesium_polylepis.1